MPLAVIKTGGKQYVVQENDILRVEKLSVNEGSTFSFDEVLFIGSEDGSKVEVGTPMIGGAKVEAKLLKHDRTKKVSVVQYKAKVRYHKARGHRQWYSKVQITKLPL